MPGHLVAQSHKTPHRTPLVEHTTSVGLWVASSPDLPAFIYTHPQQKGGGGRGPQRGNLTLGNQLWSRNVSCFSPKTQENPLRGLTIGPNDLLNLPQHRLVGTISGFQPQDGVAILVKQHRSSCLGFLTRDAFTVLSKSGAYATVCVQNPQVRKRPSKSF